MRKDVEDARSLKYTAPLRRFGTLLQQNWRYAAFNHPKIPTRKDVEDAWRRRTGPARRSVKGILGSLLPIRIVY